MKLSAVQDIYYASQSLKQKRYELNALATGHSFHLTFRCDGQHLSVGPLGGVDPKTAPEQYGALASALKLAAAQFLAREIARITAELEACQIEIDA